MTQSNENEISSSLHHLQATRIPLIQRLNQQFVIESRYENYANDIQTLERKNRALLNTVNDQQHRVQRMRLMLHQHNETSLSSPESDNDDIAQRRAPSPSEIENTPEFSREDNCSACVKAEDLSNDTQNSLKTAHDIAIHHREHIQRIKDDKADHRRSQFLHRIDYIEKSIEELKMAKDDIPAQQAYLARKMQQLQQRIVSMVSELERISPLEDNVFVSCDLLHACRQTFTKKQLARRLKLEMTNCRNDISTNRLEMIRLKKQSDSIVANISKKNEQLGERKAALLQYDKQRNAVSKMRVAVSKEPLELKRHFLTLWRNDFQEQKRVRKILESVVSIIRRRLYARAWKHWTQLGSSHQSSDNSMKDVSGIGTDDLLIQEARLKANIDESYAILRNILKTDKSNELDTEKSTTTNLLGDEIEAILLKGDLLFNAEHFDASLKCYERVESMIGSQSLSINSVTGLHATVVYKIGSLHLTRRAIDLAIVYFGRSLSLSQEEDNLKKHQVSALIGLGKCYMQKNDFRYATYFLQQSLPLIVSRCEIEKTVYSLLKICYEHLNMTEELAFYSSKIHNLRDTREERVDAAFEKMNSMRQRLINVCASNSRVVKVRASSTKRVSLAKLLKDKERELLDTNSALRDEREFSLELQDFEQEIMAETDAAQNSKKKRIISFRVHDSSQEIMRKELLIRLDEKLNITRAKQEECLQEIAFLERTCRNLNDDIHGLTEEMAVEERPLIKRVLDLRNYRCIAMNASNVALGNIRGGGGNEYVALSSGKDCYIHNMDAGELETVFMGDTEGKHVGQLIGHTGTITALFCHGKRIYTGSVDCSIICWDVDSEVKLFQSTGHEGAVTCIYSDGNKTLSGAADKTIILWSSDGILLHRISGHVGGVHLIRCGLSWFASSSYGTIFVWEMINRRDTDQIALIKCRQRLSLSQGNITALQYNESDLVTGDNLGCLKVWNAKSGEAVTSLQVHQTSVTFLQVDVTKAVSCGQDMLVQVTDIIQGCVIQTLRGHTAPILTVAFDQTQIVSVSSDGEIRMWSWRI